MEDTVLAALDQIKSMKYDSVLIAKGISKAHIRHYGFAFKGKRVLIGNRHVPYAVSQPRRAGLSCIPVNKFCLIFGINDALFLIEPIITGEHISSPTLPRDNQASPGTQTVQNR